MAAEAGIDLRTLQGSGPGGRIIKRDIEAAISQPKAAPARQQFPRAVETGQFGASAYHDEPASEIRKMIAKRLVTSIGPVPHFFLTTEIEMDRAAEMRKGINALDPDLKISVNDIIIKVAAAALIQHPAVNASFQEKIVRYYEHADIGVAVAIEDGLITPVVRAADQKSLSEIAAEVRELAERARSRKLKPEEYTGATFSVSNLGMFGIDEFTAVINPPEGAILAPDCSAFNDRPSENRSAIRLRRVALEMLALRGREAVGCGDRVGVARMPTDTGLIRLAQPRRRFDERIEYGLQVEGRAADHLEHVGGGGLLCQRFAQLTEQSRILDRDDGLGGEVRDKLDLLVGEPPGLLTIDGENADQLIFLEHRNIEDRAEASEIDGGDEYGLAFDVCRLHRDVDDLHRLPRFDDTGERGSRTWSLWSAVPELGKCRRYAEHGTRPHRPIVEPEQNSKTGLADAHRTLQHDLEHRLQLAWRAADDAEHLRSRRLLLQRLGKLARARVEPSFQLGSRLALAADARLRLRSGRRNATLRPAFRRLARQASSPVPSLVSQAKVPSGIARFLFGGVCAATKGENRERRASDQACGEDVSSPIAKTGPGARRRGGRDAHPGSAARNERSRLRKGPRRCKSGRIQPGNIP